MDEQAPVQPDLVSPPEVMYETRVDDKGRIKIPERLKRYLDTLPDKDFFITTFDLKIAQIYPMQAWLANKKLLFDETANPDSARRLKFVSAKFGDEVRMDAQGRLLVPQSLRKLLGIENATVSVMWAGACAEIYSAAYEEEMLNDVKAFNSEDLAYMRRQGLK